MKLVSRIPRLVHGGQTGMPPTSTSASVGNLIAGPPLAPPPPPSADDMAAQDLEVDADVDEEFQEVETYSEYLPAKLSIGHPHPDPVVETSSLSTVKPPNILYKLSLPRYVINEARLSSLQLESVIYASQQHQQMMADGKTRRGFLIGDGPGVGKGRTIAGIIYENYQCGRKKSIWLSVSSDLRHDAIRDLRDIGLESFNLEKVRLLKDFAYGRKISLEEGVVFLTYTGLVRNSQSIKGNLGSRMGQLLSWVGNKFDGVIVFDECHKAKTFDAGKTKAKKVSKVAECVLELQNKLPNARIVYVATTGVSEPRYLGYMTRLGIWGPGTAYSKFNMFFEAIERRGFGAMELVAVDLKMRGSYIARQLSFKTTNFSLQIAPLSDDFVSLYDQCVDMWALALKHFREVESIFRGDKAVQPSLWALFWAAHQKFFKYLCISAKVPVVVEITKRALAEGKCVVVGLQSIGEAKTREALEDGDINEFVSTARATFESLIDNHLPVPPSAKRGAKEVVDSNNNLTMKFSAMILKDDDDLINEDDDSDDIQIIAVKTKKKQEVVFIDSDEDEADNWGEQAEDVDQKRSSKDDPLVLNGPRLIEMRDELMRVLEAVAPRLPNNTLDDLIDRLGGPTQVAEMTGRRGRVVKDSLGKISYKQRNVIDSLDNMNIAEKQRFMSGDKLIAVISSEAASSGISLQADRRVQNQRRRVHITIELPLSADRAILQFGRTHRSNQVSGPEYVFIISEMAGERCFASVVAKRLESLGALESADRRVTADSRDSSQFNISSKFCRAALERVSYYIETGKGNETKIKPEYRGNFIRDAREAMVGAGLANYLSMYNYKTETQCLQINVFLNRLLGMKVHIQKAIFKLFTDHLDLLIKRKKITGQYDAGILELNPESGKAHVEAPKYYRLKTKTGNVQCTLRDVKVDRGITWEKAIKLCRQHRGRDRRTGFYVSVNTVTKTVLIFLIIREGVDMFRVYRPNVGRQPKPEYYENVIRSSNKRATIAEAERIWRKIYADTDTKCVHMCFFNNCKRQEAAMRCDIGKRHRMYTILSGSVLTAWPYLEKMVPQATNKLQIVRVRLDVHNRVIGPLIPQDYVEIVKRALSKGERDGVQF